MAIKTTIRVAEQGDLDHLWDFLALAAYEPDAAAAMTIPVVASHLFGWKRPGDFGFVATRDGKPVGAAWARQFRSDETVFYLDDRTPELSIAVREEARGHGIGTVLLTAMITDAAQRGRRLCLNVRDKNPARHLYERAGFTQIPGQRVRNRTGGFSLGMLIDPARR